MSRVSLKTIAITLVLSLAATALSSPAIAHAEGNPQTALKAADLDDTAFTEGMEGRETQPKEGPKRILWTQDSRTEGTGLTFGDSNTSGTRHLRIGL